VVIGTEAKSRRDGLFLFGERGKGQTRLALAIGFKIASVARGALSSQDSCHAFSLCIYLDFAVNAFRTVKSRRVQIPVFTWSDAKQAAS